MKVAGFAGIAFMVGSALAGCSAPVAEAPAPLPAPVAPVTAPATVQAPAPVVAAAPKATAPAVKAPAVHAAAIPATPAKTVAVHVAPAKRYIPCSAVGMVADANGVCHAKTVAKLPVSAAPVTEDDYNNQACDGHICADVNAHPNGYSWDWNKGWVAPAPVVKAPVATKSTGTAGTQFCTRTGKQELPGMCNMAGSGIPAGAQPSK